MPFETRSLETGGDVAEVQVAGKILMHPAIGLQPWVIRQRQIDNFAEGKRVTSLHGDGRLRGHPVEIVGEQRRISGKPPDILFVHCQRSQDIFDGPYAFLEVVNGIIAQRAPGHAQVAFDVQRLVGAQKK